MNQKEKEIENQINQEEVHKEQVLLVGVDTGEMEDFDYSMEELMKLAEACHMEVLGFVSQRMERINKAHYIGAGKIEEVKEFAHNNDVDLIIFNNSLTPSQLRNLQTLLEKPVMDRTALILEIFHCRAKTREAKLQVETARLQYMLSRLVGMHEALTRQGGTSGSMSSRGAGEKKLELDRRRIEHRISELKKELQQVKKERETQRKKRLQSKMPKISLVGYTNAGKSTIMNKMVELYLGEEDKKVFEKDMLFATLDTTVRSIHVGNNQSFLLSDTVGFIHQLPHGLVEAFHSTLEDILSADLILHVVDYADPHYKQHIATTNETLRELKEKNGDIRDIPILVVNNKVDQMEDFNPIMKEKDYENKIFISARNPKDIKRLVEKIIALTYNDYESAAFLIPYTKGAITSYFMENAVVERCDYREDGVYIQGRFHKSDLGKYAEHKTTFLQNG